MNTAKCVSLTLQEIVPDQAMKNSGGVNGMGGERRGVRINK